MHALLWSAVYTQLQRAYDPAHSLSVKFPQSIYQATSTTCKISTALNHPRA